MEIWRNIFSGILIKIYKSPLDDDKDDGPPGSGQGGGVRGNAECVHTFSKDNLLLSDDRDVLIVLF